MDRSFNFDSLCQRHGYQQTSLDELMELGDNALGKEVYIHSHGRQYKGFLSFIFQESNRVWLEKAMVVETKKPVLNVLTLFFSDIIHIAICGVDKKIHRRILKELDGNTGKTNRIKKQHVPLNDLEEAINPTINGDRKTVADEDLLLYSESLPPLNSKFNRPELVFVNFHNFKIAMSEINKENLIGVSAQDNSVGRKEQLIWLAVATSNTVFFIDFFDEIYPENIVKLGLKDVLTNPSITKVMIGGQYLEDYFYHQHGFKMENVHIPEVLDCYFSMKEDKIMPRLYRNLKILLKEYLGEEKKNLPYLYSESDIDFQWSTRPLPKSNERYLFERVFLLRELHQALLNRLLLPIDELCQLHLAALRDSNINYHQTFEETIIPPSIQNLKVSTLARSVAQIGLK